MKLNKTQVNALTKKIYDELSYNVQERNKYLIKESVHTFLKTDVGKAVTKVNTSFFDIVPIPDYTIKNLAMKYYGHILYKVPRVVDIENDIIIESIASDDVTNLIQGITQKYSI